MDVFALLIPLAIFIAFIASYWVIYTKAGEAGWKCLIPIYNLIVLLKIINKPVWWIILILIPLVNIVIIIMIINVQINRLLKPAKNQQRVQYYKLRTSSNH